MKAQATILLILLSVATFGQNKVSEKQAIQKSHLDFTKEYLWFEMSGQIEIDGHIYKNDTCPIIYEANLDEVRIYSKCDPDQLYEHRTCSVKGCNIIHLIKKERVTWDKWNPMTWPHDSGIKYNLD